jgi:glucan phosphoethanolaminetransferase (alkaline phosphatase superfamily)
MYAGADVARLRHMDVDHPERDQSWDLVARSETETQRLDRNWASLLQELRVVQTGVQFLTGFLLVLPFQQRFDALNGTMRAFYLTTVACSVASTVLLLAPVAMHRLLFRQRKLLPLVSAAHRMAFAGLSFLGLALTGVTVIIFDTVAGHAAAVIAATCTLTGLVALWIALPLVIRIASRSTADEALASDGLRAD